ncbi:MAG: DUF1439 domain-containing protein [Betaproteobacteria bacterium]|nr:DUF1439 domain-containing protein [Betaproteobacteria bacterium]
MTRYLLIMLTAVSLGGCGALPFVSGEVKMSADELTQRMAKRFPVEKSVAGLLDVTLANPRVALSEADNRITTDFMIDLKLALTNKKLTGTVRISGRPDYVPETRSLFLRDAKVDRIRVDNMSDSLSTAVAKATSTIARDMLEDKPLHVFKPEEFSKYGVGYTPDRIIVRGDMLVLKLR